MIFRICLIALMLLLIASTVGWSNNILFYVLSTRNDSGGWYTGPGDVARLTDAVKAAGHSVKVEDETTVKDLTLAILSKYEHVWILEGDEDSNVEVSKDEAEALYQYYQQGAVIWISTEEGAWAEDTKVFMNGFDVDVESGVAGPAAPKRESVLRLKNSAIEHFKRTTESLLKTERPVCSSKSSDAKPKTLAVL